MKKEFEEDCLKRFFSRLPEEELPADFTAGVMKRIYREAAQRGKTTDRLSLQLILYILFATTVCIASVVLLLSHFPGYPFDFRWREIVATIFSGIQWEILYKLSYLKIIGSVTAMAVLLLGADQLFRDRYAKNKAEKNFDQG